MNDTKEKTSLLVVPLERKVGQIFTKGKDGHFYTCCYTRNGWKCGFCGRGNVAATKGYKCRVCDCVVAQVVNDGDATMPVKWVSPNVELRGCAFAQSRLSVGFDPAL